MRCSRGLKQPFYINTDIQWDKTKKPVVPSLTMSELPLKDPTLSLSNCDVATCVIFKEWDPFGWGLCTEHLGGSKCWSLTPPLIIPLCHNMSPGCGYTIASMGWSSLVIKINEKGLLHLKQRAWDVAFKIVVSNETSSHKTEFQVNVWGKCVHIPLQSQCFPPPQHYLFFN